MNFLKKFSIYTLASLISVGVPFLILPLLTFYLTPADYGNIRLFNIYVALLIPVLTLTSYSISAIEYYNIKGKAFNNLFTASFVLPLINTIPVVFILFVFNNQLEQVIHIPFTGLLGIVGIALFNSIYEHFCNMLIQQKKAVLYAVVVGIKTVIESGLTLLFVINFKMGWEGRIYSWAIAVLFLGLVSLCYYLKEGWLFGQIFLVNIKKCLIYGLPLIFHQLGKFVINQSDTFFISKMVSIKDAGIYSFGYQFGSIVMIISSIMLNIYTPFLFERLSDLNETKKKEIVKFSYFFLLIILIVLICISVSSPLFFRWFVNPDFYASTQFVFLTGLAYFFWGCYLMFSGFIFYKQKTMYLLYISIVNIVLNLSLNYILILNFGVVGASYATIISFFVIMLLAIYVSNKLVNLPWLKFRYVFNI